MAAIIAAFIVTSAAAGTLHPKRIWDEMIVPAGLVAFVLLILPVSKVQSRDLYFGAKRLADTVQSLADSSFVYPTAGIPWIPGLAVCSRLSRAAVWPFVWMLLSACVLCGARSLWKLLQRRDAGKSLEDMYLCLLSLSLVATVALVVAAHLLAGLLYPLSRTALNFIPLSFLAASCLLYRFREYKIVWLSASLVALVCLLSFISEANASFYAEWRFDAGTKRIVNFIRSRYAPEAHLKVRASWVLEPSLNFYRLVYRLNWDAVDHSDPKQGGDIVVLRAQDEALARTLGWPIIYKDVISEAVVAEPTAVSRPH